MDNSPIDVSSQKKRISPNLPTSTAEVKNNPAVETEVIGDRIPSENQALNTHENGSRKNIARGKTQITSSNQHLRLDSIQLQKSPVKSEEPVKKRSIIVTFERFEFYLFLIYTIIYLAVIFNQFQIANRFKVNQALKKYFLFNDTSSLYVTSGYMTIYLNSMIDRFVDEEFWFLDKKYEVISNFRITQRKIKNINNTSPVSPLIIDQVWADKDGIQLDENFDPTKEDSAPFGENDEFLFNQTESFMELGGYVMSFNRCTIYSDNDTSLANEDLAGYNAAVLANKEALKLKFVRFIQNNTLAVVFDVILGYYELAYLCHVMVTFQISKNGLVKMDFNMYLSDVNLYTGGWAFFRAALEGAFAICLFIYIFYTFISMHYNVKQKIAERRKKKKSLDANLKKIECCTSEYSQVWINVFFSDYLALIHLFSLILSLTGLILWVSYIAYIYLNLTTILEAFETYDYVMPLNAQSEILLGGSYLEKYRSLVTINFLFLFFRVLKLASNYIPYIRIFIATIGEAISDIVSFFLFFICIIFGFSLFSFFFYGRYIRNFSLYSWSLEQTFSFAFGIINATIYQEMYLLHGPITLIYFLLIIILIRFIISKLLLAILLHYYKNSLDVYRVEVNLQKKSYNKESKSRMLTLIDSFKKFANCVWNFIFCKCFTCSHKTIDELRNHQRLSNAFQCEITKYKIQKIQCPEMKPLIKQSHLDEKKKVNDSQNLAEVKDIHLYDSQFYDDYEFTVRNAKLDSEKDSYKLRYYYEKKYRGIFVNSMIFIFFTGVFILMFFLNVLSPWHHHFHAYLEQRLQPQKSTQNYDEINSPANQIHFFGIKNITEVRFFLFDMLPDFFTYDDGGFNFVGENFLICESILLTVKKQQPKTNWSYEDSARYYESMALDRMDYENKSFFQGEEDFFLYNKNQTYNKYGGFSYIINLTTGYNSSSMYPAQEVRNGLIDTFLNYAIAEFFVFNAEYDVIMYVSLMINQDWGANYYMKFHSSMVKCYYISSWLDILKLVMETIFLLLICYLVIKFIALLISESKAYDKWYLERVNSLKIKVRTFRAEMMPEFLRKLSNLFTLSKCQDLIIISLSFGLIYLRAQTAAAEGTINRYFYNNGNIDLFYLRDIMCKGTDAKWIYDIIGCIIIFLASLNFIATFNLGKFFSLLLRTIEDSKNKNLTFILILLLIQPCFIFYAHLSFGERNESYGSIEVSIMSCIQILFGYIDFYSLSVGNSVFGPIFFFCFLICVNLILINLFFAIIDLSYTNVKADIRRTTEEWNWKSVFLFCCHKLTRYKDKRDVKASIDLEFNMDNVDPAYGTQMLLDQDRINVREWKTHERNQIKILDDTIYTIKKKRENMKNSYHSTVAGTENLFEDNLYKDIEQKHVKCFELVYLRTMLTITEELERNILEIERYSTHLKNHKAEMNYEKTIEDLKKKCKLTLERAANVDKDFVGMENDLINIKKEDLPLERNKNIIIKEEDK